MKYIYTAAADTAVQSTYHQLLLLSTEIVVQTLALSCKLLLCLLRSSHLLVLALQHNLKLVHLLLNGAIPCLGLQLEAFVVSLQIVQPSCSEQVRKHS